MNIMVVGGAASLVQGNLGRKLKEHDIDVGWHVAGRTSRLDKLPKACEGVLVIIDMVGHGLSDAAVDLAAKRDIPLALIPRKWSHAEASLRARGFLPAAVNGEIKKAAPAELAEMALSYICDERRRGRVPKLTEVEGMLQRAFGPKVKLSGDAFQEAHSRACAAVPGLPQKEDREGLLDSAYEWARILMQERPGRARDYEALVKEVREHMGEKSVVLAQSEMVPYVERAHSKLREEWASAPAGSAVIKARNDLICQWLRRWFEGFKAGTAQYPTQALVREHSRAIFGIQARWNWTSDVRAQVLGEWARNLEGTRKVFKRNADKLMGMSYDDFIKLMADGEMKGLKVSKVWNSSDLAVEEWLAERSQKANAPAPTPVAPEPIPVAAPVPVVSTEDVAVAVAALVEGEVVKRVEALLKPVTDEMQTLREAVGRLHEQVQAGPNLAEAMTETHRKLDAIVKLTARAGEVEKMSGALFKRLDTLDVRVARFAQVEGRFQVVEEMIADQTKTRNAALKSLGEAVIGHSAKDSVAALGKTLGKVEASLELVGRAHDDHVRNVNTNLEGIDKRVKDMQTAFDAAGLGGEPDMSLRDLAFLAEESGLQVNIQAGPRPVKDKG
jgi:hypothetical protein